MNTFLIYSFKASLCLGVLYLFYLLILRKENLFSLNRFFLLGSLAFSFTIPLININLPVKSLPIPSYSIPVITLDASNIPVVSSCNSLNFYRVFGYLYLAGCIFFVGLFVFRLVKLYSLVKLNQVRHSSKLGFVLTNSSFSPFSFFKKVFLNPSMFNHAEQEVIVTHEQAHADQWHSLDILLLELVKAWQWFNPLVWLYTKTIKEIHEYLADENIKRKGFDIVHYEKLLLSQACGIPGNIITNNFNHSMVKRRIKMLSLLPSRKKKLWKVSACIPLLVILIAAFAFSEEVIEQRIEDGESVKIIKIVKDSEASIDSAKKVIEIIEKSDEEEKVKAYILAKESMEDCKESLKDLEELDAYIKTIEITDDDTDNGESKVKKIKIITSGDEESIELILSDEFEELFDEETLEELESIPKIITITRDGDETIMKIRVPDDEEDDDGK